jgi:hypothetical protein
MLDEKKLLCNSQQKFKKKKKTKNPYEIKNRKYKLQKKIEELEGKFPTKTRKNRSSDKLVVEWFALVRSSFRKLA